ncbi:hypothetical protein AB0D67_08980 [Streptosporangium sp. NPDC048047]|uniref:hypothetical protein n=1 Tax=Streptosporangium sp. NPDC048047 TaxID=3155748 RepID=UPI00342B30F2
MTAIKESGPAAGRRLPRRLLLAALTGVILTALLVGAAFLMMRSLIGSGTCDQSFACLGAIGLTWFVGRWVAVVLAWPLLHLLRVRPAWPVAVAALLFLVAIWRFAQSSWAGDGASALILLSGVIAYPLAALITAPRLAWPWRAVPAALFLALCVLPFLPAP